VTELDDNWAPAHASLGFLLMKLGEPVPATAELLKALELDARNPKARANLAALKCRFGDAKGAREELARLRSQPNGPDVDPEYAACRK